MGRAVRDRVQKGPSLAVSSDDGSRQLPQINIEIITCGSLVMWRIELKKR